MSPSNLSAGLWRTFDRFRRHHQGSTLVLTAVAMPVVIGGLALAIDTGMLYLAKRQVQQQADAAAVGVALAKGQGTTSLQELTALATRDAVRNGYVDTAPNSIAVNIPPTSGSHTGDNTAVEVVVQTRTNTFFAGYFNFTSGTVSGRAVAGFGGEGNGGGGGCILALNPTASRALRFQGAGTINAQSCTVLSNSTATDSVYVSGAETLRALGVYTAGQLVVAQAARVELTEGVQDNMPPVADPYADLQVPTSGACNHNSFSVSSSGTTTINPGTYCNGLTLGGSGEVRMNKGTYIIKGGNFSIDGAVRVRCGNCTASTDGITVILTAGSSGNIGTVSIGGATDVQLAAPSGSEAGALRGVAIYQDRNATPGNAATFAGASQLKISGAIYLPAALINYTGASELPAGKACVQIIGRVVEVQGASRMSLVDCPTMGVRAIEARGGTLVMLE